MVVCAVSQRQGRIIYNHLRAFHAPIYEANRKRLRVIDNLYTMQITDTHNGANVQVLPAVPKRMHGIAPVLAILDEPASWDDSKTESAFAALHTSLDKLPNSRLLAIGTKPKHSEHWFRRLLRSKTPSIFKMEFAADSPHDLHTWNKANPSLAHFPDLLAQTKRESETAKHDSTVLQQFKAYRLNMGVSEIAELAVCDPET